MTEITLKALRDSIAHWKRMLKAAKAETPEGGHCPLCLRFHHEYAPKDSCMLRSPNGDLLEICPVRQQIGGCAPSNDNPWGAAWIAWSEWVSSATRMITFLNGLRPAKKRKTPVVEEDADVPPSNGPA